MQAAREYHQLALDCLELAEAPRDPTVREQMIRLATRWARMADGSQYRSNARHNMAKLPMTGDNTGSGRVEPDALAKIGHELRAAYDDVKDWELPERLRQLLKQLGIVNPGSDGD
jgi:anti-sigma factor NepR-like protein